MPPKKISLKTIAQLAGCSTTTVSNILNKKGLFGDEIRDRVLEIVRKYNYAINASARSLKMGKSETVALVFYRPNVDIFVSEYYLKMMYGFQKRLAELGFEILLSEVSPENAENGARPRFVSRGKADAIVVLGQVPDSIVKSLRDCGLPMLMLDSHFDGIDSIYTDGRAATAALTAHIAALGHKRVAYLAYDNSDFNTDGRIDGFEKTAAQANLAAKVFRNFKTNDEGCDVLEKVLAAPDRPTAILAGNDDLATSLMRRARELGAENSAGYRILRLRRHRSCFALHAQAYDRTRRLPAHRRNRRGNDCRKDEKPRKAPRLHRLPRRNGSPRIDRFGILPIGSDIYFVDVSDDAT